MSAFSPLVKPSGKFDFKLTEPIELGINTRVCVEDVDADGKWDLVVGDTLRVLDEKKQSSSRTGSVWIYFGD